MKIIADENMPYVQELFGELGEIVRVAGRTLTPNQLQDADVLLVRSVTRVDEALLSGCQRLKFVGTATIGTDHIDTDFLKSKGISFASAPGCNAIAVGQFVFMALLELASRYGEPLKDKRVAIIGAGNTGSALAHCLDTYGVEYRLCDPLLAKSSDPRRFYPIDELLAWANVVTMHVPLTQAEEHSTWHLMDDARLKMLTSGAWLVNCCRGEVIDNRSLVEVKLLRPDIRLVLDVWEGEPHPLAELVPLVDLATPHIAGYSLEGKARGSYMLYQALCEELGLARKRSLDSLLPPFPLAAVSVRTVPDERTLLSLCRTVYDLRDDDWQFRRIGVGGSGFDDLRKGHKHRREFSAVAVENCGNASLNWLFNLGFSEIG